MIGKGNDKNKIFSQTPADYTSVIKREKKANITVDNIDVLFLCQIPGVSTTNATAILKHFGTLYLLTDSLFKNPKCLENTMTFIQKFILRILDDGLKAPGRVLTLISKAKKC